MVHLTHSVVALRRSIRKFIIDNLVTVEGLKVFFDFSYSTPDEDKWVVVVTDEIDIDFLASTHIVLYLFTKNDISGDKLASLRDTVYDYFLDLDITDGKARMPLYDEDWDVAEHIVMSIVRESGKERGETGTFYRWIQVRLNWGAK